MTEIRLTINEADTDEIVRRVAVDGQLDVGDDTSTSEYVAHYVAKLFADAGLESAWVKEVK